MSLLRFNRTKRYVRIGGRQFGPLVLGGGWYEVRKLTLWEFFDYQAACTALEEQFGVSLKGGAITAALVPVLRCILPVLLASRIKRRHLHRASDEQVMVAVAEFAIANDIELCTEAFTPSGDGEGIGFEVLVCQIAREFHVEPQVVLAWPLVEILGTIEALKAGNTDPEDENDLAHYGLDGKGYTRVAREDSTARTTTRAL